MGALSPLCELHRQMQAETQDYFGTEVVSTYGRLPLEYAAAFRSVAMMDRAFRGVIEVSGEDRLAFLNSLLTAELVHRDGMPAMAGQCRFAFLLDRKGRLIAEMNVLDVGERCLLDLDARLVEQTVKELEKYHFRERVTMCGVSDQWWQMAVYGPAAAKVLADAGLAETLRIENGQTAIAAGGSIVIWRDDLGDSAGYYQLVPTAGARALWEKLAGASAAAKPIGWAAYNAIRVEAGRPLFGIDYDVTFLAAETGQLERAVSFTKGCYPGQEIVARMASRDQCARRVVQLRGSTGDLPLAGEVVADSSGAQAGVVTSSTISPRLSGVAICLATLKKPAFDPGTRCRIAAEGGFHDFVVQ